VLLMVLHPADDGPALNTSLLQLAIPKFGPNPYNWFWSGM
jgi:hypothetical protein